MLTRAQLVTILLWYNVISLGIWVGGTVYQMLVIVPIWSASPPESVHAFFGSSGYLSTIGHFFGPVTMALRVVPLLLLVAVAWTYATLRPWLVATAATIAVGLVMTLAYVYPINAVLIWKAGGDLAPDAVRELAGRWVFADRLRFAIMSAGYVCLLRAFQLPLIK